MKLLFLGRGNSSNINEGNTAAYFIENRHLFLIDCGETVFSRILLLDLLSDIDEVHVMITHTHSDHVGSLGSFIMYCYFNVKKKFHIILSKDAKHKETIQLLLKCYGCNEKMYDIVDEIDYDDHFLSFDTIRYFETKHVDYMSCYGILFKTKFGTIYYSGDSRETIMIERLLKDPGKIDKMYVDVTSNDFPDNIHLYIGKLHQTVPNEYRKRVYCMHFNNDFCISTASDYGFSVVSIQKKESSN